MGAGGVGWGRRLVSAGVPTVADCTGETTVLSAGRRVLSVGDTWASTTDDALIRKRSKKFFMNDCINCNYVSRDAKITTPLQGWTT